MSETAVLIAGCALATAAIKAAGPIAFGGRPLPPWSAHVIALLVPALLGAFVATQALADGQRLAIDAETAGVLAGCAVAWRWGSLVGCVLVAAAVTAGLRAL